MKRCKSCGTAHPDQAVTCAKCGASLSGKTAAIPPADPPPVQPSDPEPRDLPLGYLPLAVVFERLKGSKTAVDALLKGMAPPGTYAGLKKLTDEQKLAKARELAADLKDLEPKKYKLLTPDSILICQCYRALADKKPAKKVFDAIFGPDDEVEIKEPVARFCYRQGLTIFVEVPIGKSKADIIGYRRTGKVRLIAVELKTRTEELKKCFAQLMDYQSGVDRAFLATTPGAIVKYLCADKEEIDPRALDEELRKCGAGLIVVDHRADVCTVVKQPPVGQPSQETRESLIRGCDKILEQWVPIAPWSSKQV